MKYLSSVWSAFEVFAEAGDKLLNACCRGDWRMTISARMGFAVRDGRCVLCKGACAVLGFFWKNHCSNAADNFTKQYDA